MPNASPQPYYRAEGFLSLKTLYPAAGATALTLTYAEPIAKGRHSHIAIHCGRSQFDSSGIGKCLTPDTLKRCETLNASHHEGLARWCCCGAVAPPFSVMRLFQMASLIFALLPKMVLVCPGLSHLVPV